MTVRQKNLLILALMVLPFIASALYVRLFVHVEDMPQVNKGTLLVPHVQFIDLKPTREGQPFPIADLAGQWSMLYLANGSCDTRCKNGLYYLMRQLRLALGSDAPRVRRVIGHAQPPTDALRQFLDDKVPGMLELQVDGNAVEHALQPFMSGADSAFDHIFLMAPDGQIFIWYPSHDAMEDVLLESDNILFDLKRTLKGSLLG